MGKIIRNGVQYTSDGNTVSCELTWAEYNALSDADKMNGTFYYITDIEPYNENNAPLGFTPIGTIISVMGNHAPFNYLKCDGSVYNIIDYPELANYFEIEFGSKNKFGGNGTTTFAVPDLQGEFLRGTGTNSHTEQGNGGDVGTHQDATILPEFAHDLDSQTVYLPNPILTGASTTNSDSRPSKWANNVAKKSRYKVSVSAFDTYLDGSGGAIVTSRPTNTSVLYCIATKNIYLEPKNMYSTDEQVVGQWIDGKPIYQITLENTYSNVTTSTLFVPTSVFNVTGKQVVGIDGIFLCTNGDTPHGLSGCAFMQGASGI